MVFLVKETSKKGQLDGNKIDNSREEKNIKVSYWILLESQHIKN